MKWWWRIPRRIRFLIGFALGIGLDIVLIRVLVSTVGRVP